jgi:pimeloyl-ACP methyl ester carboxylesterase
MYRVARLLAAPLAALFLFCALPGLAHAVEAYIFRGAGDFSFINKNLTFSDGMDRLGEKFVAAGMYAQTYRWQAGDRAYRDIMQRKPEAVALMGHSMGALTAITLAGRLKGSGINIAYLGLIDIPGPANMAPDNVMLAENFFHAFPVYGRLIAGPDSNTIIRNEMIHGQIHVTMDNAPEIHNAMLASAGQFAKNRDGGNSIVQAYADEKQREQSLASSVDAVLTGSTSNEARHDDTPVEMAALAEPANIPVPTPNPGYYNTASGLPPIE